MKYFRLLWLVSLLLSCNGAQDVHTKQPVTACDAIVQKLRECIGAEVVLVGECVESSAEELLGLDCLELLDAVGILSSNQPYTEGRRI